MLVSRMFVQRISWRIPGNSHHRSSRTVCDRRLLSRYASPYSFIMHKPLFRFITLRERLQCSSPPMLLQDFNFWTLWWSLSSSDNITFPHSHICHVQNYLCLILSEIVENSECRVRNIYIPYLKFPPRGTYKQMALVFKTC